MTDGLAIKIAENARFNSDLPHLPKAIVAIMDLEAMAHSQGNKPTKVGRTRDNANWGEVGFGYSIGIAINKDTYYMFLEEPDGRLSMVYTYSKGSGILVQYNIGKKIATFSIIPPDYALNKMLLTARWSSTKTTSLDSPQLMSQQTQ